MTSFINRRNGAWALRSLEVAVGVDPACVLSVHAYLCRPLSLDGPADRCYGVI
jgi:hypothetical protein